MDIQEETTSAGLSPIPQVSKKLLMIRSPFNKNFDEESNSQNHEEEVLIQSPN